MGRLTVFTFHKKVMMPWRELWPACFRVNKKQNNYLPARPGSARLNFLSQGSGTPDAAPSRQRRGDYQHIVKTSRRSAT